MRTQRTTPPNSLTTKQHAAAAIVIVAGCCLFFSGCGRSVPGTVPPNMMAVEEIRTGLESAGGGATTGGAVTLKPTGFATLRGRFVLEGTAPEFPPENVDKDLSVCTKDGVRPKSQLLVVDEATKGIKNIAIWVEEIPTEWIHESARPGKMGEVDFDQKNCIFDTHVATMQLSQTLKVLNSDPIGHNTNVLTFNQTIPSGSSALYQPPEETRSPANVTCSIHPWMKAYLLVRENGYFAVTEADGSFEIPNLPTGVPLQIRVWQEKAAFIQNVTINGQARSWPKGNVDEENSTIKPAPEGAGADDKTNFWDVKVSADLFK